MKKVKTLKLASAVGAFLVFGALQVAQAETKNAYAKVLAASQVAALKAKEADMKGARATCYIAQTARETALKSGIKENSPEFQTVVARATYTSAQSKKIADLLKDKVTLRCKSGAILPSARIVGGSVLAIGAIAALANSGGSSSSGGTSSNRAPSP